MSDSESSINDSLSSRDNDSSSLEDNPVFFSRFSYDRTYA